MAGIIGKTTLFSNLRRQEPTPEPTPWEKAGVYEQKAAVYKQKAAGFGQKAPVYEQKAPGFGQKAAGYKSGGVTSNC